MAALPTPGITFDRQTIAIQRFLTLFRCGFRNSPGVAMYVGIDAEDLAWFRCAMRTGSIRAASEELDVEPSAVSRRMAKLASVLGVRLFERQGRGLRPTEAATLVLVYCREREISDEALRIRLDEMRGLKRGALRIMAGDAFVGPLMDDVLAGFCRDHPAIHVQLGVGGREAVLASLLRGECDIGVTLAAPPHAKIRVVCTMPRPVRIIAHAGHPIAMLPEPVSFPALAAFPIGLATAGTGLHLLVQAAALEQGQELHASFTADRVATLRRYALSGLGVTFLSEQAVAGEIAAGTLIARRSASPMLEASRAQVLVRADRSPSAATLDCLERISDVRA